MNDEQLEANRKRWDELVGIDAASTTTTSRASARASRHSTVPIVYALDASATR
jgi:hypothetical protein